MNQPPFNITETILNRCVAIAEILGSINALRLNQPIVKLRKQNKINTIYSSLAIEGNTLSIEQVTCIVNQQTVLAAPNDIQEVKNAAIVYQDLNQHKFNSIISFKNVHKQLMKNLIKNSGLFRSNNVGVFAGTAISHMAPPFKHVPRLMNSLFSFIKRKDSISLLLKACVFHYELEFIHPFTDGNGRMGRLWQQITLMQYHPIFEFLAIESLMKENQQTYYQVLRQCDQEGESTLFIEFNLALIQTALSNYQNMIHYAPNTKEQRIKLAGKHFVEQWFSRQDYMRLHKNISPATASRDLNSAISQKLLTMKGDKRLAVYQFISNFR